MGVLQLFFFRAITLIAFLHNVFLFFFLSEAGFYYVNSLSGCSGCGVAGAVDQARLEHQAAPGDRGWLQQALGPLPVGRSLDNLSMELSQQGGPWRTTPWSSPTGKVPGGERMWSGPSHISPENFLF